LIVLHPDLVTSTSQGSSIVNSPSKLLNDWWLGQHFLLFTREADGTLDLQTSGFIKDITRNEIVLNLENAEELRLPILSDMIFRYSDVADEQIKCSVVIERPGFKFLLSLRRKQPVIRYRADSDG
jgi:hypothetical protein